MGTLKSIICFPLVKPLEPEQSDQVLFSPEIRSHVRDQQKRKKPASALSRGKGSEAATKCHVIAGIVEQQDIQQQKSQKLKLARKRWLVCLQKSRWNRTLKPFFLKNLPVSCFSGCFS